MADTTEGRPRKSSMKQRFFDVKRRMTQTVLEKVGKAEKTPDTEYEERKKRALELCEQLKKANAHIQAYVDAMRALCLSTADLGVDFKEFFHGGDPRVASAGDRFRAATIKIDEEVRKEMDDRIVTEVFDHFKEKFDQFNEIKALMKERERVKVDFDYYVRNVRSLKAKANPNPRKLGEKENKLATTRKELEERTADLLWRFDTLEDNKPTMILHEFQVFVDSNIKFFTNCQGLLGSVGDIPTVAPPAARERPVVSFASAALEKAKDKASDDTEDAGGAGAGAGGGAGKSAAGASGAASAAGDDKGQEKCKALYNYEPQGDDELKLMENDIITVLNKQDDGWWEGTIGTRRGVFPANYVAPV